MVDSLYSSFCFHLVDFSPEFDYFLQSILFNEFASFCSRVFRCAVKLLVYALSSFFLEALGAMGFPLSMAFIVSHKFKYVVASFSLNSKMSLISLFLLWPNYHWVEYCSVSIHIWAFHCFCWYLRTALVRGDLIGCMGLFQSSCICWGLFCDWLYGQFWRRCHEVLRIRHILFFFFKMKCSIDIC